VAAGNRCNSRFVRGLDHVRKRTLAGISFDTFSRTTSVFGVVTQNQTNIVFFLLFEGGYEDGILSANSRCKYRQDVQCTYQDETHAVQQSVERELLR